MCASAFAMSCVQDVVPGVPEAQEETVVFTASVDAATKTTLNGVNTEWVAGDKITIHNGTKGFEFKAKSSGAKSEFTYTGSDFSGEKFMAVYPSGTYTADVDKRTVKVNIPTWQQAKVGSWDANAAVGVAYSENTSLAFKNATALLEFQVNTDKVTHVVFHGNGEEAITGDANVTLTEEGTKVEVLPTAIIKDGNKIADKGSWVEIYAWHSESDKYFKKGQTYYAAVAPQVLSNGVTVKVKIDEGDELEVKKSTKSLTLQPSHIYNLGTLEYKSPAETVLNWGVVGTMTNWAKGADIPMTLENDWYVAKNVTIKSTDEFKFRTDNDWGTERTCTGPIDAGVEVAVTAGSGNITIKDSAIYDVYLSKAADKMKLVKVGDVEAEQPEEPETPETPENPELEDPDQPAEPEQPVVTAKKVYLKPNSNWKIDNARFAAYFFGGAPGEVWVSMTVSDVSGVYELTIPEGYDYGCNIIFCRMNPSTTANNWNTKWNQTADLKTPTDGKNLYTVKEGTWDNGGGTWSKK